MEISFAARHEHCSNIVRGCTHLHFFLPFGQLLVAQRKSVRPLTQNAEPVVTLFVNKTAECFKCPGNSKALPQIACKGNQELCQKPSNSILKTTCILKEILPIPHFDCAFENQYGYVKTAGYELKFERFENNTRCILNDSYYVWYTMDFGRHDYWLILKSVNLGLTATAFTILLALCCYLHWNRRKPREERLMYTPSPRGPY
ncbi:uncharacterized protein LOC111260103 isoform X1 [Varroa jacobsoni]|uniref:Uncharacterized protein n=1 Tax=Varroa destructor TaxID=109461 RepID=A0A7M7M4T7_VARDE|nr:uncharacterized protein LOC111245247 isoform X2 [Varroa destructor]XP_022688329.1 uncharacterized protein LOC111260103 isoform X1 [Varroa jacobsoni]